MSDHFIFGNADSRTLGAYVFGLSVNDSPARRYESLPIPGRNGDLLLDNKSYDNSPHSYTVVLINEDGVEDALSEFVNMIACQVGYQRLEDSLHPEEFYLASYRSVTSPIISRDKRLAKVRFEFDRKPQRFLKLGETITELTTSGSIINPTFFNSKPIFRVYGTGSLEVGNITLTINAFSTDYMDIDCDMMDAHYGTTNLNDKISSSSIYWPELEPGTNGISISGLSKVIITPRWWKI